MTKNKIFSFVLFAIVLICSSCASEELHLPENDDTANGITVTHDFGFCFTEGDIISVFSYNEWEEESLAGELTYDSARGIFCGHAGVNPGDSCRLVFNNTSHGENDFIYIPSSQAFDTAIPLETSGRFNPGSTYHLEPYHKLTRIRIEVDPDMDYAQISSEKRLCGVAYLDGAISGILCHDTASYMISDKDKENGFIDICVHSGEYPNLYITFAYTSHGGGASSISYSTHNITLRPEVMNWWNDLLKPGNF